MPETTPPRKPDPLVILADEHPWTPEEIAEFKGRLEAAMANQGPFRVRWKDRAEAAEAKLAAIAALCRECYECPECGRGELLVKAEDILAITGSEGDA